MSNIAGNIYIIFPWEVHFLSFLKSHFKGNRNNMGMEHVEVTAGKGVRKGEHEFGRI